MGKLKKVVLGLVVATLAFASSAYALEVPDVEVSGGAVVGVYDSANLKTQSGASVRVGFPLPQEGYTAELQFVKTNADIDILNTNIGTLGTTEFWATIAKKVDVFAPLGWSLSPKVFGGVGFISPDVDLNPSFINADADNTFGVTGGVELAWNVQQTEKYGFDVYGRYQLILADTDVTVNNTVITQDLDSGRVEVGGRLSF